MGNNLVPAVSNQLLLFTLGEPRYALYLSVVERVVQAVEIMALPKAPPLVLGLINVRGQVIPVVDIRGCFGMPARELTVSDQFILARTAHRRVAVVADAVSGVVEPLPRQWVPVDEVLPGTEFVRAVAKLDDTLVMVCDLDQILSLETEQALDEKLAAILPAELP
ncbi:MAG: chemotaxis protein CheW [Anaerolineales bacterium]